MAGVPAKRQKKESEVERLTRAVKVAEAEKKRAKARREEIDRIRKEAERASAPHRKAAERAEAPYERRIKKLRQEDDYWQRSRDYDEAVRMLATAKRRQAARDLRKRILSLGSVDA